MYRFYRMLRTARNYWKMAHDPRTPPVVRYLLYGGVLYTAIPEDWLPDGFPALGLVDDAVVIPSVMALASVLIPQEVKEEHTLENVQETEHKRRSGAHFKPSVGTITATSP